MDRVRLKLLVAAVVILGAFGYLFLSGMKASQVYYLTVAEYQEQASRLTPGDPFRISGRVQPDTVKRSPDGLDLAFTIYDPAVESATLKVQYHGVVPDTFMENSEVVLEGGLSAGTFSAHTLLAKCPSKYEALAEQAAKQETAEGTAGVLSR